MISLIGIWLAMMTPASSSSGDLKSLFGQAKSDVGNDVATAMAVDGKGDVFLTGYSKAAASGYDYLTLKYDTNGKLLWSRRLDGGDRGDDRPSAIGLDAAGNVYVTGSSEGGDGGGDYLTVKYGRDGEERWSKRYNGSANGFDRATALAVDATGDVWVTGFSLGKGTGYDCVTVHYDPLGNELWASRYDGPASEDDYGTAIKLDEANNAYVAGYSKRGKSSAAYLLLKLSPDGRQEWTQNFSEGPADDARTAGLAIGKNGALIVTGSVKGPGGNPDIVTVAYDATGKQLWTSRFNDRDNGADTPSAIGADAGGDVILAGASEGGNGQGLDFITLKYSEAGKRQWLARTNGADNGNDVPTGMVVSSDGSSVVTGYSRGSGTGSDFLTVAYAPDGTPRWQQRYNGPANDEDRPVGVGADAAGNVYVGGYSWGGKSLGFDFVVLRYNAGGSTAWVKRFDSITGGSYAATAKR